jgi:hypothetical protein
MSYNFFLYFFTETLYIRAEMRGKVVAITTGQQRRRRNNKTGRPTKYKDNIPDRAYRLCLLGLTNEELALAFDVNVDTIHEWRKVHPAFSDALRRGRRDADAGVAVSLYRRAIGYSHPDTKIFMTKEGPVTVPITKHYPPDVKAAIYWLTVRQKERWQASLTMEHTGKDGGPIQLQHRQKLDLSDFSKEELLLLDKLGGTKLLAAPAVMDEGNGSNGSS